VIVGGTNNFGGAKGTYRVDSAANQDASMVRVDEPPRHFVHEQLVSGQIRIRRSRMQDGVRSTSRRCGGSFAKQVAANVEKGETATLLGERLKIRLDENLDGLFAGINLDTNRRVAEIDLVSSPVLSANDGVGHWVWLSEIGGLGLAKRLSGGRSRDVSGHFPSINQI
jgi:hypothetical protein